jgi:hypothetical protein
MAEQLLASSTRRHRFIEGSPEKDWHSLGASSPQAQAGDLNRYRELLDKALSGQFHEMPPGQKSHYSN